jgi:hypothetical protein
MKPHLFSASTWLFLLCLGNSPVVGQHSPQNLIWYGYTMNADLSSRWFNETEFMERHFISPFEQSQFLIRTRFHKRVSNQVNYGLGGSLFLFHRSGSNKFQDYTQPELRPHAELNYRLGIGQLSFENRFRGELRYFQNIHSSKKELSEGYYFASARLRYRLQAIIHLLKIADNKPLKLKLADEFMVMAGGRMKQLSFDQNRISADLSLDFSPRISLDFGYLNWYQATAEGGFLEQHIFRTVMKHQISSWKK